MKKVILYVDGYNFYHATKDNPSANIDLRSLALSLLQDNQALQNLYYFSAYATWRKEDLAKHKSYVSALKKSGVSVVMSYFKKQREQCSKCNTKWYSHEEKETDVKLALQILEDGLRDKYDTAFILSGDSDISPAIERVRKLYPAKRFLVVLPKSKRKFARDITSASHGFVNLSPSRLKKHLFDR